MAVPADAHASDVVGALCLSLVDGPRAVLGGPRGAMDARERARAALRARAVLLRPAGLRRALAPTRTGRTTYAALPDDALAGTDASVDLARRAVIRAAQAPWSPHLMETIAATEHLLRSASEEPLAARLDPPVPLNRAGLPLAAVPGQTCRTCAWSLPEGGALFCRVADAHTLGREPACERWEPRTLDCIACGACCREAFHTVVLTRRDVLRKLRPDLITDIDGIPEMPRPEGRCPALAVERGAHLCTVYAHRPTTCRSFAARGDACLSARRAVGLTR